nr:MAG TPA: hypothetical protein [Caudoviricetes sp.]
MKVFSLHNLDIFIDIKVKIYAYFYSISWYRIF